jgi:GDPmannose 4,6-dehydratase
MLQAETPDTFVLATNETTTVRDFVKWAFKYAGIELKFEGSGIEEVGRDADTNRVLVRVNPKFFRPAEVDLLIGNPEKSRKVLGWTPLVKVQDLCKMMVEADLERVNEGKLVF